MQPGAGPASRFQSDQGKPQMASESFIDNLTDQIRQLLPRGGPPLPPGFADNLKLAVNAALARSSLVTREDFDAQAAVLQRTRQRLEALEARVAELEEPMANPDRSADPT